jgi:hypothetical protein
MRCSNCGWPLDECNESQPVCPRCGDAGPDEISEAELTQMLEVAGVKPTLFAENGR